MKEVPCLLIVISIPLLSLSSGGPEETLRYVSVTPLPYNPFLALTPIIPSDTTLFIGKMVMRSPG